MSTLYELFKVDENASQQEIADAYKKIIEKAEALPQTEELNKKIQRIKIAYGILSDVDKRKNYDLDLATKRADALLENVKPIEEKTEVVQNGYNTQIDTEENQQIDEEKLEQEIKETIDKKIDEINKQKNAEKELKKQERKAKRLAKKEMEYKREKEIQDYGRYLGSQGYKVKYPWTWPRVRRLLTSIVALIVAIFILWHIPFVRNSLISLYEENFVVKFFVDIIISLFSSIASAIK